MSDTSITHLLGKTTGRRSLLRGTAAAGALAAGASLLASTPALADTGTSPDSIHTIFTVARTAEQLAITFYTHGLLHAKALGLHGDEVDDIKAAVVEEQIHQFLFTAQGGDSLATSFSFPAGVKTFTDLATFITTQQQLEGAFDAAFISAVKEFAQLNQPRLSQIACQIAMIESEHRVLGRSIARRHGIGALPNTTGVTDQGGVQPNGQVPTDPADNWAFAPALLTSVGQAPTVLANAGYLGPNATYMYQQVITPSGNDLLGLNLAGIYQRLMFKTPYTV